MFKKVEENIHILRKMWKIKKEDLNRTSSEKIYTVFEVNIGLNTEEQVNELEEAVIHSIQNEMEKEKILKQQSNNSAVGNTLRGIIYM